MSCLQRQTTQWLCLFRGFPPPAAPYWLFAARMPPAATPSAVVAESKILILSLRISCQERGTRPKSDPLEGYSVHHHGCPKNHFVQQLTFINGFLVLPWNLGSFLPPDGSLTAQPLLDLFQFGVPRLAKPCLTKRLKQVVNRIGKLSHVGDAVDKVMGHGG